MRTILAPIDHSAAARPVLSVALEVARLLGGDVDAVHVPSDAGATAQATARALGVAFRTIPGPVAPSLVAEAVEGAVQDLVVAANRPR